MQKLKNFAKISHFSQISHHRGNASCVYYIRITGLDFFDFLMFFGWSTFSVNSIIQKVRGPRWGKGAIIEGASDKRI